MNDEDRTTQPYQIWWDEAEGIVHGKWAEGTVWTLSESEAVLEWIDALDRGPIPVLVDIRLLSSFERPARERVQNAVDHFTCVAMLAESAVTRMIANFALGLSPPPYPVRMFTSEAEALSWLRSRP